MARVTARAEVLNYVAVHPGRNAAKVAEKLNMAPSRVRYIVATDPRIHRDEEGALRLIAAPDAKIGLVAYRDKSAPLNRRHDCALLARCELAWIDAHGTTQGYCPRGYKWYKQEAERPREVSVASCSSGGVGW